MPEPEKGETEAAFLRRCIPYMIKQEERERAQSAAICFSVYRRKGTEAKSPKPEKKKLCKGDKCKVFMAHY